MQSQQGSSVLAPSERSLNLGRGCRGVSCIATYPAWGRGLELSLSALCKDVWEWFIWRCSQILEEERFAARCIEQAGNYQHHHFHVQQPLHIYLRSRTRQACVRYHCLLEVLIWYRGTDFCKALRELDFLCYYCLCSEVEMYAHIIYSDATTGLNCRVEMEIAHSKAWHCISWGQPHS